MAEWIAVGPPENWEKALEGENIWGVPQRYEKLWSEMREGDLLFFYVTSPVKGVVGYGRILSTFREEEPFWPQEQKEGRALWPLRMKFKPEALLPKERWAEKAVRLSRGELMPRRALQKANRELSQKLLNSLT